MAKLEINGKVVEVDDSFLQLSPEQQQSTVEEIAGQMGAAPQEPAQGDNEPSPAFKDALAQIRAKAPGAADPRVAQAGMPTVDQYGPGADGQFAGPAPDMSELSAMTTGFQKAPQEDTDRLVRANMEATKLDSMMAPTAFNDASKSAQKSFLGNFGDEAYSGVVGAPMRIITDGVGYGEGYKRSQALQKEMDRRREIRSPTASMVGNVFGGVGGVASVGPGGLVERGAAALPFVGQKASTAINAARTAAPRATQLGSGLADATALGATYEAGDADAGNRLEAAGWGALTGFGTGLAGEGIAKGVGKVASKVMSKGATTQTSQELAKEGNALYTAAKSAGVTVKPSAINHAAGNVTLKLKSFGFDKDLQPKTAIVAKKLLESRNKTLDLSELDNIRKMASGIAREKSAASSDREAAGIIVEQIDNIIDDTANFSAGSSQALDTLKAGREVWKRKMKTETIEDIVEKAQNQATGFENGLVIHLRALANNKTKLRAFSKAEQKMIKSVVRRGSIHGVARAIGMLAPNSTFGGLIAANTAFNTGILPGVGIAAAGGLAKAGAGAVTRGKVNTLQRAVSTGQLPSQQLPSLSPYVRPLIGGGVAGTTSIGNSSR